MTITDDVAERYPAPFYEPLSTLGWLAARTSNLMIGTTVSTWLAIAWQGEATTANRRLGDLYRRPLRKEETSREGMLHRRSLCLFV